MTTSPVSATDPGTPRDRCDPGAGVPLAGRALRVAVASDRSLVAETVRAALSGRGLVAEVVPWPGSRPRAASEMAPPTPLVDVLLVMSEARDAAQLALAGRMLAYVARRRVALTSAPRGAVWGALLASGADYVAAAAMTLHDLECLLRDVVEHGVAMATSESRELIEVWRAAELERHAVAQRLSTLTARESQVLDLLRAGQPVRAIADSFAVTEATVRSQVKSVLRKLEVKSQLAAVAVVHSPMPGR